MSSDKNATIAALFSENRTFPPSAEFVAKANLKDPALYEQARYAPPEEALSDIDLAAARRNLCFLAGVSAA